MIQLDTSGNELPPDERLADRRDVMRRAWHLACEDALGAYRAWCDAARTAKADAHAAFVAAADREAAAAEGLRRAVVERPAA